MKGKETKILVLAVTAVVIYLVLRVQGAIVRMYTERDWQNHLYLNCIFINDSFLRLPFMSHTFALGATLTTSHTGSGCALSVEGADYYQNLPLKTEKVLGGKEGHVSWQLTGPANEHFTGEVIVKLYEGVSGGIPKNCLDGVVASISY